MNLVVYFGLSWSQNGAATDLMALQFWVGILMLISAGSFLYVATIHILPEVWESEGDNHGDNKLSAAKQLEYDKKHYNKAIELFVLMTGLYLPMMLQFVPDE